MADTRFSRWRAPLAPLAALALLLASACSAATDPEAGAAPPGDRERPARHVVPGEQAFPGGIAYHEASDALIVGSTRDGTLFRGSPGVESVQVWLPGGADGRTTTSGLNTDQRGRLYVGGGPTNRLWIYDLASTRPLATLAGLPGGFVNDVTIAADGTGYATDSLRHVIYRITERDGRWQMLPWLDLSRGQLPVEEGHNLNGIIAAGEANLLTVNSRTGALYRIDRGSGQVTEVDLGGTRLYGGDGLLPRDDRLYVVQGGLSPQNPRSQVTVLRLAPDLSRGTVEHVITDPAFRHPSTARIAHDRLLVVNSQYNTGQTGGRPELPFTISAIPLA